MQGALSNAACLGVRPATLNCQKQKAPEPYPMQLVLGSLVNPRNGSDLTDTPHLCRHWDRHLPLS
eukprot:2156745-Lingulodinium_polyedra.AAC.1